MLAPAISPINGRLVDGGSVLFLPVRAHSGSEQQHQEVHENIAEENWIGEESSEIEESASSVTQAKSC